MTTSRRTRRWRGIVVVALTAVAAGVLAELPAVMLLGVVGVAYAAYPRLTTAPEGRLDLDRTIDADSPAPGDDIRVTVRLHNAGQRTLADLRLVDGVPPMLGVTEGTPRHGAFLRPGATTEFTYTVTATHGTHRFEPATVIARDIAGAFEIETEVSADLTIEVLPDVPEVPLRQQTQQFFGDIPTDEGGSGVEFHSTREYHPGDALAHIDWHRYAKTGQLSTLEYREERGAAVVLCVDAREPAYRAPATDQPHAVASARTAAEQLFDTLSDRTDTVGLAALSDREFCWLGAGAGAEHRDRARQLLTTHPAMSTYPPEEADPARWSDQLDTLRSRLSAEEQVILLTPLADSFPIEAALTLEAAGHSVTVVSPDVSGEATLGQQVARTERRNRVHSLRESDVRVVNWPADQPLGAVLVNAQERWSR